MTNAKRKKYLNFITKVNQNEFNKSNTTYIIANGKFIIEVYKQVHDLKDKNSTMNLWYKHGYVSKKLKTTIYLDTYFYDDNGNCWGRYNITHDPTLQKLNFNYIREYTVENVKDLLAECIKLFLAENPI